MNKTMYMLSASLLTLVSLNAFAVDTKDVAHLSTVSDVKVVINKFAGILAVQPTGYVKFSHESCAQAVFEATTKNERDVLYVKINNMTGMDCMGPTQTRAYSVQISSDFAESAKVVVLNPLKLTPATHR